MLSLLAGCETCPEGYRACAGQCWRLLDQKTNFWSAAPLCLAESIKHGGEGDYITIPSPRNSAEDTCANQLAGREGVWLGFIETRDGWRDYMQQRYMSYSPWAFGEPQSNWWSWEPHIVLIPAVTWEYAIQFAWFAGWHDWNEAGPWRTLCATRYCADRLG